MEVCLYGGLAVALAECVMMDRANLTGANGLQINGDTQLTGTNTFTGGIVNHQP